MALARALAIEPEVLLLDEPFGALDANVRKDLRAWLRRLHDEMHVTTVFVTHDQEEAMEVSDRIVIVNHGKVEQVGDPHELYDEPANDFVMGFVGPVTRLGDTLIRPHDIEIRLEPNGTTHAATIIAHRPARIRGADRPVPGRRPGDLRAGHAGGVAGARSRAGQTRVRASPAGGHATVPHAAPVETTL